MDKALFVEMSGQQNGFRELQILSNNLANVNTPGFKADYEILKSNPVKSKLESRVYSGVSGTYTDFKQGPTLRTGRDLDLAISGNGMFVVQSKTGKEGYLRAGNFEMSPDGFLITSRGEMVLGENGVIHIPNSEKIEIGSDGTISAKPLGEKDMVQIGKIKLVNPDFSKVEKGEDGLFYPKSGAKIEKDSSVRVNSGVLEASNVNPVDAMIRLIDVSRLYEIHSNFIRNLAEQATQSNRLLDTKA